MNVFKGKAISDENKVALYNKNLFGGTFYIETTKGNQVYFSDIFPQTRSFLYFVNGFYGFPIVRYWGRETYEMKSFIKWTS